jgi:quinol monooxygenase YgiN
MPKIAQYAKFAAKPGQGAAVREALEKAADAAANETGTLVYIVHVAVDDPDTIWMYELYASVEDQQAHSSSDATATLRATVGDLLVEPLVVSKGEPARVIGLSNA